MSLSVSAQIGNDVIEAQVPVDEVSSWQRSDQIGMYAYTALSAMVLYDIGELSFKSKQTYR